MIDTALQAKTAVKAAASVEKNDESEGMSYLESLPRRLETL
jgi:multiple sugar transport system permease protein